jgi:sugar lactone lactonase YvrE
MFAVLLAPLQVGAAGGVEPVIDYDFPFLPEGIALDKKGNIYVSLANQSELRKITPDGSESVLATLPIGGFGLLGLAVDASGNVYAALATTDPGTSGVYRVNRNGASERLPGSENISFPNSLVFDKQGNLYVTDTTLGAVWKIPRGGQAEPWLQDELLEGTGDFGFGIPIGANGIVYRKNTIHVANTEKGSIVSIPVNKDGSAGTPENLIVDPGLSGADGLALDVHGDIYVVRVIGDELVRINMDNATLNVLASDGLDSPASLAFGTGKGNRQSVFIANFALISNANPGVVKVDVGVAGLPLP